MLELPPRPVVIQSAAWSPWQSSVVAIGLANGLVEIWDILISTSRPQKQIRISRSAITGTTFLLCYFIVVVVLVFFHVKVSFPIDNTK